MIHIEIAKHESNVINLEEKTCLRKGSQVFGLPCKHTCTSILLTDINVHRYINGYDEGDIRIRPRDKDEA